MTFISRYLVAESKREVCYKTHEEFLTLFSCSIRKRMMENKKTGREKGVKHITKMGEGKNKKPFRDQHN
jgi:hypothetical protein